MEPQFDRKQQCITVGKLRKEIENLKDDDCIYFGCADLTFQRIKPRGNGLYQIEFDQIYEVVE